MPLPSYKNPALSYEKREEVENNRRKTGVSSRADVLMRDVERAIKALPAGYVVHAYGSCIIIERNRRVVHLFPTAKANGAAF